MPKFKNIRIKMKNGKYRTQKVMVKANGQYKFVKNTKKKSTSKSRSSGRKLRVTKKKSSSSSKKSNGGKRMGSWHIGATVGILAYPAALALLVLYKQMTAIDALGKLSAGYSGFNPVTGQVDPQAAMLNYGAIAGGTTASFVASKLGINRFYPKNVNI